MRVSCMLLLLLLLLSTVVVGAEDAWSRVSNCTYDMCRKDAYCAERYYMDSSKDMDKFEYFLGRFVSSNDVGDDYIVNVSDLICGGGGGDNDDNGEAYRRLWLYFVRTAQFCTNDNEVFKRGIGCVCENGKYCGENHAHYGGGGADKREYNTTSLLAIVMIIFCVFVVIDLTSKQVSSNERVNELEKRITQATHSSRYTQA